MSRVKLILNIFGPSTAGKSTTAELLQKKIDRMYTVDYDVIKRQISGYYWKRDSEVATEITYDTLKSATKTGLPILLLLPPPKDRAQYERIVAISNDYDYQLVNIEITAPRDVLIKRYQERLRKIEESGSKWKFKTLEEFVAKLETGYYRSEETLTLDSSVKSPDEILHDTRIYINQHLSSPN